MLTLIASITAGKGAIGRNGQLLYHISDDLKRFKEFTTGNTVVMGRLTFESLPKGALPNRRNIVVTRSAEFAAPGAERASSVEEALKMADDGSSEVFIIGGAQLYSQTIGSADRLLLTLIEAPDPADADAFFPPVDPSLWETTELSDRLTDPKTGISYRYLTLSRTSAPK